MEGMEVRAFGFQFGPLGTTHTFGTFRMEDWEHEDIQVTEDEGVSRFKGWTRLLSSASTEHRSIPGSVFAHLDIAKCEEEIVIKTHLAEYDLSEKLYFVLFVKADAVQVGPGMRLEQRQLKKYFGPSRSLFIEREGVSVELDSSSIEEMQVIPLEGETSFWGADFMIAYEMGQIEGNETWKLRKEIALI